MLQKSAISKEEATKAKAAVKMEERKEELKNLSKKFMQWRFEMVQDAAASDVTLLSREETLLGREAFKILKRHLVRKP